MPHSYGASFSGVGFFGPRSNESPMLKAPNPNPSPSMMRMGSHPSMRVNLVVLSSLVNVFSSGSAIVRVTRRDIPRGARRDPLQTPHAITRDGQWAPGVH